MAHEPHVTAEDAASVVRAARSAQATWAEVSVARRIKALTAFKQRVLARAEALARTIHEETGKPEAEALLGEVLPSADVFTYWASIIEAELEPFEVEFDAASYPKKDGLVHREPRGVVALVMPYNFPFALPLRTMLPALLAGNAVVLKPSEVTPRTGALLVGLFDALVPSGLVGLVQGDGEAGAALVASDVDFVVFTGSPKTGRAVAHACAERLVPCALELGGKDAAIVLADADLDRASNGILWGAMMNAGQNCGAVERVYAVASVAKPLVERLTKAAGALRLGVDVGPLTTDAQRDIVRRHVDEAREAGATVHVGGEARETDAMPLGYAPTVVSVTSDDAALVTDETFGPVVAVLEVADVDEAIRRANASRYGLTASLWTRDTRTAERLARRLRVGVVTINNHSFTGAVPSAPWGGVGESGWGFTGSPLALDAVTRPRVVVTDRSRSPKELWWFPYTDTLRTIALTIARFKGGSGLGARLGALLALPGLLRRRRRELRE